MGIQVQSAFKDGQGKPLPFVGKQFISFSYGGKNIEEFDLLVVFKSDRLEKGIYAPFNDTTTEQAELDGQMFWTSNFRANRLTFNLATDGMTSDQLEEFKIWFQPGFEKELILSEHHNRGILARVSEAPQISFVPFEKEIEIIIGRDKENKPIYYKTKTSLYKGEIILNFVMDDPYWYSVNGMVDNLDEDSVKIVFEDGIPHSSMLKTDCFLANKGYFNGTNFETSYSSLDATKQTTDTFLYYCGTAPAKPEISFDVSFDKLTNKKVVYPYLKENENLILQVGTKTVKFGLPSLLYSYNKVIDIIQEYREDATVLDLRAVIRDSITNYYTRSFAIAIIDYERNVVKKEITDSSFKLEFLSKFEQFIPDTLHFTIDSKIGKITSKGNIKTFSDNKLGLSELEGVIENAGNMIKTDYLIIENRKLPQNGIITAACCSAVTTNSLLSNLKINYKYMYL